MRFRTKLSVMDSSNSKNLRTGCSVPESGIYSVSHRPHALPREVTLLREQVFPRCSRCSEPVSYRLVRSAPAATSAHTSTFKVALYELPELSMDEEAAS